MQSLAGKRRPLLLMLCASLAFSGTFLSVTSGVGERTGLVSDESGRGNPVLAQGQRLVDHRPIANDLPSIGSLLRRRRLRPR